MGFWGEECKGGQGWRVFTGGTGSYFIIKKCDQALINLCLLQPEKAGKIGEHAQPKEIRKRL